MTFLMEQLLQQNFERIGARLTVREQHLHGTTMPAGTSRFDRAASFSIQVFEDSAGARYELVLDPALPPPRLEVVRIQPKERKLMIRVASAASNDRFQIECGRRRDRWFVAKIPQTKSISAGA